VFLYLSATQALVIANGVLADAAHTRKWVLNWQVAHPDALIIAVDGGALNALALGLMPKIVIGDMDSLAEDTRQQLVESDCQFHTAPARKDETDLELALRYAVERRVAQIRILGALGGRIDQTLANLFLLALPLLADVDIQIVDGPQTIWLVRDRSKIAGVPGDTLSLIPLVSDVHGVSTAGLDYALNDGTLPFGESLGISNVLVSQQASVRLAEGLLLVIHTAAGM